MNFWRPFVQTVAVEKLTNGSARSISMSNFAVLFEFVVFIFPDTVRMTLPVGMTMVPSADAVYVSGSKSPIITANITRFNFNVSNGPSYMLLLICHSL